MADRTLVQALTSFTTSTPNGVPVHVEVDELFWSDDPLVAKYRDVFGEPNVRDSSTVLRRGRLTHETAVAPPDGTTRGPVTKTGTKVAAGRARPDGEV